MSYDDRQANAPLVQCPRCGRRVYATHGHRPDWRCISCREAERKQDDDYTPTLEDA
jgi:tRNA(Ile2) C34 agmatinyltransferase TiaS